MLGTNMVPLTETQTKQEIVFVYTGDKWPMTTKHMDRIDSGCRNAFGMLPTEAIYLVPFYHRTRVMLTIHVHSPTSEL